MTKEVKKTTITAWRRWRAQMPTFFRNVCACSSLISGAAIAINTAMTAAGAEIPQWWAAAFPYFVGVPAGIAFCSKFTSKEKIEDESNY